MSTRPFRADIVGSFLRPAALKAARQSHADGRLDAAGLRAAEDAAIADLVTKQADAGLLPATDGEFRRSWWHFDFFDFLDGVEIVELDHGIQFRGVQTKPRGVEISGPIRFDPSHPFLAHYSALQKTIEGSTGAVPKFTIPAPTVLDFRLEPDHITAEDYDGRDAIVDDLVQAYRDALAA
ncbi:MAG: 5-methyltetrahydropteroyltriglutamate--homocysteine S-methyltransferase, partial [Microbacterium sp. 13-71-7]